MKREGQGRLSARSQLFCNPNICHGICKNLNVFWGLLVVEKRLNLRIWWRVQIHSNADLHAVCISSGWGLRQITGSTNWSLLLPFFYITRTIQRSHQFLPFFNIIFVENSWLRLMVIDPKKLRKFDIMRFFGSDSI